MCLLPSDNTAKLSWWRYSHMLGKEIVYLHYSSNLSGFSGTEGALVSLYRFLVIRCLFSAGSFAVSMQLKCCFRATGCSNIHVYPLEHRIERACAKVLFLLNICMTLCVLTTCVRIYHIGTFDST